MPRHALQQAAWVRRAAPQFWKRYNEERRRRILPPPQRPSPKAWPDQGLFAAWIGHSTALLKIDGVTGLTDPVISKRVGIALGPLTLGIKRIVAPALRPAELPKIDVILLSHAHMDHFDIRSLRKLESRHATVITAANTSDLLRVHRYGNVRELRWGARMRSDTHRGYNGYTIEAGRYRLLFGGDTALTDSFRRLKGQRPYDLAIMPVGAYDPWIHYHCTPEQAWRMAQDAGFEFFLPVHHQ